MLGIYFLMSWWNIIGWTDLLLSESISMSLFFIWIASLLYFIKKQNWQSTVYNVIILILFSFSRDTWPYILVFNYLTLTVLAFLFDKKLRWKSAGILAISILVFFVQKQSSEAGHRHRLPVMNNIVFKILPNETYTQWFIDHGMPQSSLIIQDFAGCKNNNGDIFPLYYRYRYQSLHIWADQEGKSVYTQFLLSHPNHALLFEESDKNFNRIFAHDLKYAGKPRGIAKFTSNIFPLFNLWSIIVLVVLNLFCFYKNRDFAFLIPGLLLFLCFLNALLLYNADAMEVERHLFITQIFIEIIGFLGLALLLSSENFRKLIGVIRHKVFGRRFRPSASATNRVYRP